MKTTISPYHDLPIKIPKSVAVCPKCDAAIIVEDIDEWETDTGKVTRCGLHITCENAPDIDSDEWKDWFNWHWSMPYVDWLPLYPVVLRWFNKHYRVQSMSDADRMKAALS